MADKGQFQYENDTYNLQIGHVELNSVELSLQLNKLVLKISGRLRTKT